VILSQTIKLIDTPARFRLISESLQYMLDFQWCILEFALYMSVLNMVFFALLGNHQPDCLHMLMIGQLSVIWFSKRVNQFANSGVAGKVRLVHLNLRKEIIPVAVTDHASYRQLSVCGLLLSWVASADATAPEKMFATARGNPA
jgi:ABC-type polysaccharide/polyol phosphate export permease